VIPRCFFTNLWYYLSGIIYMSGVGLTAVIITYDPGKLNASATVRQAPLNK